MTDSVLVLPPGWRATDANDQPIPGAKLKFFSAGTTTPVSVYSDQGLATVLGTTITCDAGGYPTSDGSTKTTIYTGTASFKLRLTDASDAQVWEHDNIRGALTLPSTSPVTVSKTNVVSRTSTYTILGTDQGRLINADPTGGSFVLTLPDAGTVAHIDGSTIGDGWRIGVRHAGEATSNVVSVRSVAGQQINRQGSATGTAVSLAGLGQTMWFVSNGAEWVVESEVHGIMAGPLPFFSATDRLAAPPSSPVGGQRYIVAGTPTGSWSTLGFVEHDVAESDGNGSWLRLTPKAGWFAYVTDEDRFTKFDGTTWEDQTGMGAPTSTSIGRAVFEHREANGVNGGTATAGAWTKRGLNTQIGNNIPGVSFDAGTGGISLPIGLFFITCEQSFGTGVGVFQSRLNPTASGGGTATDISALRSMSAVTVGAGGVAELATHRNSISHAGAINVTVAGDFELQYYVSSAGSNGLGVASSEPAGNVEQYARVTIVQLLAAQGPAGAQGPQGPDGLDAAHPYVWSSLITGDPGSGRLRGSTAIMSSVTSVAINELDAAGGNLAAVIPTWDNSTSTIKGKLRFSKEGATQNFAEFQITGTATDNGSWWSIPVNHVASGGALSDGDSLAVLVIPTGDQGDPGTTVPDPSGLTDIAWSAAASADRLVGYDASAGATKNYSVDELVVRVDGLAALQAASYWDGAIRWLNDGLRSGPFRFSSSSQAATLVLTTRAVSAGGVNVAGSEFGFGSHGLWTGQVVQTAASNYGVSSRTLYWVINTGTNTFKLATSRANAIAGTAITLSSGSGGITFQHLADWAQGRYVIPDGLPLDGSSGAWVREADSSIVFPGWHGAVSSTATDATSGVQAAIDYARSSHNGLYYGSAVDGLGYTFRVSNLDATNIRSPGFRIRDLELVGYGTGTKTLDLSGLNTGILDQVSIWGEEANPPDYGFFFAKHQTPGLAAFPDAKGNTCLNCSTNGYFSRSAILVFSSEDFQEVGCDWYNKSRSLTAVSFTRVGAQQYIVNQWGSATTSSFQTIPAVSDGGQSNIVHSFDRISVQRTADVNMAVTSFTNANPTVVNVASATLTAAGLSNGDWMFVASATGNASGALLGGAYQVQNLNEGAGTFELAGSDTSAFTGTTSGSIANKTGPAMLLAGTSYVGCSTVGYILAYRNEGSVKVDLRSATGTSTDAGQQCRGLNIWAHFEHEVGSSIEFVRHPNNNSILQGLTLTTGHKDIQNSVVTVTGTGSTTVVIDDCRVTVPGGNAPTNGMFDPAASFQVRGGHLMAPSSGFYTSGLPGSFTGQYWDPVTGWTYVGGGFQPSDADLTAIAALSTTGLAARTATDTWALRTITGTAAEITVTNGAGIAGNPTLSLPSAITLTGKTMTGGAFTGGAWDNGVIGGSTPAAGTFTTLTVNTNANPDADDGAGLGTGTLGWSDLFLASGGVINWANGNATLTHSAGLLTSNVPFSVGTSNAITAGTIELGHATDTTLSRSSAGVLAVEGVTVALNATSATHTAGTIELGAATDTTISRVSAGVIAVEGKTVPVIEASGTFTPSVQTTGTQPTGLTYGTQSGRYTRIGDLVFIDFEITITNVGTGGTGSMQMLSLPITPARNGRLSMQIANVNTSAGYTICTADITSGSTTMDLNQSGDNVAIASVGWSVLTATVTLRAHGFYFA